MSYKIQCTIKKLSSDGSVMIKGCDGYTNKIGDKEYNLFVEGTDIKAIETSTELKKGTNWGELEFALLRDAVCNNKKVELEMEDNNLEQIKKVSLLG